MRIPKYLPSLASLSAGAELRKCKTRFGELFPSPWKSKDTSKTYPDWTFCRVDWKFLQISFIREHVPSKFFK